MKLTAAINKAFNKKPTAEKIRKAILSNDRDYKRHNALVDMINEAPMEELEKHVNDDTLLQVSIKQRNFDIAELLIDKGVNVNNNGCLGCSPLHLSIYERDLNLSLKLIAKGADANYKNGLGSTPIDFAQAFMPREMQTLIQAAALAKIKSTKDLKPAI